MNDMEYYADLVGYDDQITTIEKTIDAFQQGNIKNVAILSEPFAGRTSLIEAVARAHHTKTSVLSLPFSGNDEKFIRELEISQEIVLVDNCQMLYRRRIGGFQMLEQFLNFVTSSDKLFITTWNIYSWNYLRFLIQLETIFPTKIELSKLSSDDLKEMIMSCCQKDIIFIDEKAGHEDKNIGFSKKPVKLERFHISFDMPIPKLDLSALKRKLGSKEIKTEISTEQQVFQQLRDVSKGNPGIAKAIWGASNLNSDIEAKDIIKPQFKIDLDYERSFLLYLLLSMDSIAIGELNEIETMDSDIAIVLHALESLGLISMQGDLCSIRPEALYSVADHIKSLRLVV